MVKTLVRWAVRLAILAAVVGVVGRVLAGRSGGDGTGGVAFPPITGDTWPPVPVNPDRED